MPWIENATLKKAVASSLGQGGGADLAPHWDAIVSWANRMAYQTILAVLVGKGLTAAQADDWDARAEWNERFGVCLAIKRAALRGEDVNLQAAIDDCKEAREELLALPILIDGVLVSTGRVSHGSYDTAADRFQLDEPDGPDFNTGDGTRL